MATTEDAGEFAARRESVRRGVLRANRAVMAILGVAFLLGVAMLVASHRAHLSQRRAEVAEHQATERLWSSYLAQARAERLSTQAGHRAAALAAITNAAAIRPSLELREEAVASLGLRDLQREVVWPLLPRAYGFHFDADLEHYVVSYADDELSLYRLADNTELRVFRAADAGLGTNASVKEFSFSMTGRYIALQYGTGTVVLWERDTGRAFRVIGLESGDESIQWPPSFTADDRWLCARSASHRGRVLFIDLASTLTRAVDVAGLNETVQISPAGDLFAWIRGTNIFFHRVASGTLDHTLTSETEFIAFWWDTRGERFSVACRDSTLYIGEPGSDRLRQLGGRAVNPWRQQFSPDGSLLVTAGSDGTSRLWDVAEARLVARTGDGRAFVFGRDGERIGFGTPGREVGVWRVTRPLGYRMVQGAVSEYASVWQQDLSSDATWFVWSPPSWIRQPGFELFDLTSARPSVWTSTARESAVGFHPKEPKLFVAGQEGLREFDLPEAGSNRGSLALGAGRSHSLPEGFDPRALSFSGDGRRLALASWQGQVGILDLAEPNQFVEMEERVPRLESVGPGSPTGSGDLALSPDGRWLVASRTRQSGNPVVWDARTGRIVQRLATSTARMAFSPDGRWMVTVSVTSCTLWSVGDWQQVWKQARAPLLSQIGAAAFTGDGSLLAYTHSLDEVNFVEPANGARVARLSNPALVNITGLRFSADGHTFMAATHFGRTHLWDLRAIRRQLAEWRLDWPLAATAARGMGRADDGWSLTPAMFGGMGLGVIGVAGLLGVLVLRRQGRLMADFLRTTELATQQARELAAERELNELKSRFVAMVSHEFRTPLGITMSAVELLRNHLELLDANKRQELFDDIFNSTRHMAALMEQMLVLGRVEAGKLAFRPGPIDLSALCEKLADESLSATHRRCPIELKIESRFPPAYADESLVRHVLSNLLSNAAKYSPAGSPVEFHLAREGADAIFTVRDRGLGIPEADLTKLFQAFHRASNVGEIPGTGLGLVIVKRCVELQGGSIRVQSKPGEGSAFIVRLPIFEEGMRSRGSSIAPGLNPT